MQLFDDGVSSSVIRLYKRLKILYFSTFNKLADRQRFVVVLSACVFLWQLNEYPADLQFGTILLTWDKLLYNFYV